MTIMLMPTAYNRPRRITDDIGSTGCVTSPNRTGLLTVSTENPPNFTVDANRLIRLSLDIAAQGKRFQRPVKLVR